MSTFEFLEAEDWNALLTRVEALEALSHTILSLSDDDPIKGNATPYEGVGTEASRDDHVHSDLSRDPDYDSGLYDVSANTTSTKTHSLGTTNLMVLLTGRTSGSTIHRRYGGGRFGIKGGPHPHDVYGTHIEYITTTTIQVRILTDEYDWDYLRIQCWKLW